MNIFLDTNILIYSYDNSNEIKHKIAIDLISSILSTKDIFISTQIINEFIVVMTKEVKHPLSVAEVKKIVTKFENNYEIRETTMSDINNALSIYGNHKFSYWDSLVIATALNTGSEILYSEDLQHGMMINSLKILNPFEREG